MQKLECLNCGVWYVPTADTEYCSELCRADDLEAMAANAVETPSSIANMREHELVKAIANAKTLVESAGGFTLRLNQKENQNSSTEDKE